MSWKSSDGIALGVPSVKLNWRGEPLTHPRLPRLVDYAKRAGILEVLINSNAVELSERKSRDLIEAGLDVLIYSFDGGTKETYEKIRIRGKFDVVTSNLRRLIELRDELGSPTKIMTSIIRQKEALQEVDGDLEQAPGRDDVVALFHGEIVAINDGADGVQFQVEDLPHDGPLRGLELEQLTGHGV